jgi:hypothetical protein
VDVVQAVAEQPQRDDDRRVDARDGRRGQA